MMRTCSVHSVSIAQGAVPLPRTRQLDSGCGHADYSPKVNNLSNLCANSITYKDVMKARESLTFMVNHRQTQFANSVCLQHGLVHPRTKQADAPGRCERFE
jgi:hypothetical protein